MGSQICYWQRTRSGSVLALMWQYSSRSCRWFMEIQARIIRFYSTRDVFSGRHGTCKLDGPYSYEKCAVASQYSQEIRSKGFQPNQGTQIQLITIIALYQMSHNRRTTVVNFSPARGTIPYQSLWKLKEDREQQTITPCHREKRAKPWKTKTDQVIAILGRCPVMRTLRNV